MSQRIPQNLFVLEMANNHMGDVSHGKELIRAFGRVCKAFPEFRFAFKLQYRDLDTFIHPDMINRMDVKYVKRFSETRLSRQDFDILVAEMRANGFMAMSTPFDEASVDLIEEQGLDIIKIASCSFTDWPLLERIVASDKPIIASTAGATEEDIDRVVSFFMHREKEFAIMHCVGEYPTPDDRMQLNQIDHLKQRYPSARIGFSTHESPEKTDIIKLAVAKGATIFEKHVGLPTDTISLNAYSAGPEQVRAWVEAARSAMTMCGARSGKLPVNEAERAALRSLSRGAFAKRAIKAGENIVDKDVFFAFPPQNGQYTANIWSKYAAFVAGCDIPVNAAISPDNALRVDNRDKVIAIAQRVKALLIESGITVPGGVELEISHHYGLDRFHEVGLTMLTVVNRGYCKKLLVTLPGQKHPEQYHQQKEETFHVLFGELHLALDGNTRVYTRGEVVTVEPGVRHAFTSPTGAVIEEISSTHFVNDSFYTDPEISANASRKTLLTYWLG